MKKIFTKVLRNKASAGKVERFMAVLVVLLLLPGLNRAEVHAQGNVKLSISKQNAPFEEIVSEIESQSEYTFMYSMVAAQEIGTVSVDERRAGIERILDVALANKPYIYQIDGNVIIIGPREKMEERSEKQENQAPQEMSVRGQVASDTGEPLPGASVILKGTNVGSSTNAEGRFVINIPEQFKDIKTLVVSFIGMHTKEIDFTGKILVDIELTAAEQVIDNVVVTGIFNKAPESYTGAAIKMNEQELKASGNTNILKSIANIDPSFNIAPSMDFGSDPNQLPDITMRGRTSMDIDVRDLQENNQTRTASNMPLFIMNGFEVSLQRVMDMDEELVESITLLKDASATALYGSRGANGIVVIITKRPKPGKLRVNYTGSVNIQAPDFSSYNLMDAREKLEYQRAASLYSSWLGRDTNYDQQLERLYNQQLIDVERGVDTYWLKYPVRTGVGNRHSLHVDGGDENFIYSAGLAYDNVNGVMKESERNTTTGNIFFQYQWKNIKFQNDLTLIDNKSNNSPYGTFSEYAHANPIYTPYDDEGKLKKMLNETEIMPNNPPIVGNPLYNASLPYKDEAGYLNIQNNFSIDWTVNKDLTVRGRFGYTKSDSRSDKYLSRDHTSFENDYYTGENYKLRGSYTYRTSYFTSYETDITMNYNKTLADVHQIYAGFNYSMAESKSENYAITAQGFSAANMANLGMAAGYPENGRPVSFEEHARRQGALLNINYTYDRRYFADFSGNFEGSSKFGSNDRVAPFWSTGIGWNIHQETFLKDSPIIDALRLRASYGTTGSQNFSSFQALTTYRYYNNQTYKYWTGAYMLGLGNPDLGWQQTNQMNIGLEANMFNKRLRVNVDYYNKLTDGLLSDINIPTSSGFSSYKANIGEVRNRGVEITANAFIIQDFQRGITWSLGGSLIHNQNEILKISNSLEFLNSELRGENEDDTETDEERRLREARASFLFEEGQSMNTIFVVRSLGIDPTTGQEIFLDRNGNRTTTWNPADKVAMGVNEPKIWGNVRSMFRWKNVMLNVVFSYRAGGYQYNQTLVNKVENISRAQAWGNLDRRAYYERWQNPGDQSYFKDIADVTNPTRASSRFVMKENTFKMQSANLSYDFDTQWLKDNFKIDYLKFSLYAEDIFYISTIKQERGTSYPFSRKFSMAVTARF
ncbi:SusC/RagA family TonB-linked outer membrane protein [uncultured Draconibacterium sp.]|uniref:SusC/RagA family TonB-linked outer membrane protein n=1 Tax=uncultured Draconibacterium sp. TaxID=1573823 RepID=UPI0029C7D4DF|nr:SusC/RagA family TonB-linked outer membrane protein [uncultured Draconibacterium sp.]